MVENLNILQKNSLVFPCRFPLADAEIFPEGLAEKRIVIYIVNIYLGLQCRMKASKTAKIFMNGNSQAIRLPQEFRFEGKEVYIRKEGDEVILSPKPKSWRDFFENGPLPSEDFMVKRDDERPQEREDLF